MVLVWQLWRDLLVDTEAYVIARTEKQAFLNTLWQAYHTSPRDLLPWRSAHYLRPYPIMVSEFMLQQTQVKRVIPKFLEFMNVFPTMKSLSNAPQSRVVAMWSGLGYYRRAKYVHVASKQLPNDDSPWTQEVLESCVGIGSNTAGAIRVYAYNVPEYFIETNIRTVLLYHFFPHDETVPDSVLRNVLTQLVDIENPREFYWAMMDYGASLKRAGNRSARLSAHYKKQTAYEGSDRQLRASILRLLIGSTSPIQVNTIKKQLRDPRTLRLLQTLHQEKMIDLQDNMVSLKE